MASAPMSWRRGTALLARPMVPASSGTSQPPISRISGGATAVTVSRSRTATSSPLKVAAPTSAVVLHEARLVALPFPLGGGFALVVLLLALGQRHLQLGQAAVVPEQLRRDDRATLALHRADQPVDLLALEEQLPVAPGLVVEVRAGLGVGRDVGVDQHDLVALHGRIALSDVGAAVAQGFPLRAGERQARLE